MNKSIWIKYFRYVLGQSSVNRVLRNYTLTKKHAHKNCIIGMGSVITRSELGLNIFIGENCTISDAKIGDHSYLNAYSRLSNVTIGKFCSIASNVKIGIGEHPIHMVSTHPAFYSNNKPFQTFADKMFVKEYGNVRIGNDVWIGADVTILNNIEIGNGAIVALGSVVTKDVPPYAIVGGIPARIIKFRFDEEKIGLLNKSEWWNLPTNTLKIKYQNFHNVDSFLQTYDHKNH